jgi:hypothetical protein
MVATSKKLTGWPMRLPVTEARTLSGSPAKHSNNERLTVAQSCARKPASMEADMTNIRKTMMGLYIAVLGVIALAPMARAYEYETLYAKGAWSARVELWPDGDISCAMTTVQDGARLDLTRYRNQTGLQVYMFFPNVRAGNYRANLDIEVDSRGLWTLYDAEVSGSAVHYHIPYNSNGMSLLREIALGQRLWLYDGSRVYHTWSLFGSAAALAALADCVDKL